MTPICKKSGITIRAVVRNCQGVPIVGVPADEILFNAALCFCLPYVGADHPTDATVSRSSRAPCAGEAVWTG